MLMSQLKMPSRRMLHNIARCVSSYVCVRAFVNYWRRGGRMPRFAVAHFCMCVTAHVFFQVVKKEEGK